MSPPLAQQAPARVRIGSLWMDALTFSGALDAILALVRAGRGGAVFTPNVDHLVLADRHEGLRRAYEAASLSLVDGMPVLWASRLLRTPLPEKISGSDLVPRLLERVAGSGMRVYLLGGAPGAAERAATLLSARGVVIAGLSAPRIGITPLPDEAAIVAEVARARADLVLVGLGAPKQELFIHRAGPALDPAVCLAVGATIDFLAGDVRRAPAWMSRNGLEWLYRLAQEPRRLAYRYLWQDLRFPLILLRTLLEPRAQRLRKGANSARADPARSTAL